MSEHPTPWEIDQISKLVIVYDADTRFVCRIVSVDPEVPARIVRAVNTIADLSAAVRDLLYEIDTGQVRDATLTAAHAALAKAEGNIQ